MPLDNETPDHESLSIFYFLPCSTGRFKGGREDSEGLREKKSEPSDLMHGYQRMGGNLNFLP